MRFIALINLIVYLLLVNNLSVIADAYESKINNRPIIGILTQEISYKLENAYPGKYNSYIAASYVKYIESAGARVVPIWIGKPKSYYRDILSKINGILLPGGSTYFNQSNGYAEAGIHIYRIAKEINENGDYFPIWGICLGFELLTYAAANGQEHRIDCSSNSQTLPLKFTPKFNLSRLFKNAPRHIIKILETENVTANFHRYCITEKKLADVNIKNEFRVLSNNFDKNNQIFISSLEHVTLPFYGVQFHPEKNGFEWSNKKNIPHSSNAIKVMHYFSEFFVNEARKNHHSFSKITEEINSLIYNYDVTFTGLKGSSFEQCYMFQNVNN